MKIGLNSTVVVMVLMVLTGSINTISTKLADITKSDNSQGENKEFDHPFFQAACMFFGELCCLIVFKFSEWRRRSQHDDGYLQIESPTATVVDDAQNWSPVIFLLPALCDMTATSLMYIGLSWTYASIFQMLRGAVMIFTGIFSVVFLGRKLEAYHWIGMFVVLIGLTLVGVSSIMTPSSSANAPNPLGGVIVIVVAQVVQATQMVVEEKFLTKYEIAPLQAVGWEGAWGFSIFCVLLVPMYWIPGTATGGRLENAPDAFVQIGNSAIVMVAILGNIVSIGFFNFFGVTVTRTISATTRMVLDSVRTLVIWVFSLAIGWQDFQYMQAIGFPFLVCGMFIYNGTIKLPGLDYPLKKVDNSGEDAKLNDHWKSELKDDHTTQSLRNSLTLVDVLDVGIGFESFLKFCNKQYSSENPRFWAAVQKYQSIENQNLQKDEAKTILETYITKHSSAEIDLPAQLRSKIIEAYESGDIDEDLFVEAQNRIYEMMCTGIFPQYKASPGFDELVRKLSDLGVDRGRRKSESGFPSTITLRAVQ